jgi:hypothetical protein
LHLGGVATTIAGTGSAIIDEPTADVSVMFTEGASEHLPTVYALGQNYPNPFNPATVIRYQLPVTGKVVLKVYDLLGREIRTLVDGVQEAGERTVEFNAGELPSGTYVYKLLAGTFLDVKKMVVLK